MKEQQQNFIHWFSGDVKGKSQGEKGSVT